MFASRLLSLQLALKADGPGQAGRSLDSMNSDATSVLSMYSTRNDKRYDASTHDKSYDMILLRVWKTRTRFERTLHTTKNWPLL